MKRNKTPKAFEYIAEHGDELEDEDLGDERAMQRSREASRKFDAMLKKQEREANQRRFGK